MLCSLNGCIVNLMEKLRVLHLPTPAPSPIPSSHLYSVASLVVAVVEVASVVTVIASPLKLSLLPLPQTR